MRRLSVEAGLPLPELHSDRQGNNFRLTLFLHNLLTEEDYSWLHVLTGADYSQQEALILAYARATGAVDNAACRDISGMDILNASRMLRRLRDRGLLVKQGSGNRTWYVLTAGLEVPRVGLEVPRVEGLEVPRVGPEVPGVEGLEEPGLVPVPPGEESMLLEKGLYLGGAQLTPELAAFVQPLPDMPAELVGVLAGLGKRPSGSQLRSVILALCRWHPLRGDQLAELLHRNSEHLRNTHLKPMQQQGLLKFQHPESPNHPLQAYVATEVDDACNP